MDGLMDVAEVEEPPEPEFTHHVDTADTLTPFFVFRPVLQWLCIQKTNKQIKTLLD